MCTDSLIVEHYEAHDVLTSAQFFGEAAMYDALVTGRTSNTAGWSQQEYLNIQRTGFRFYDAGSKIILSHVEFRNYNAYVGEAETNVISFTDHSDQFLPQGINAVKALKFSNVDEALIIDLDNCGTLCGGRPHESVYSQI